MTLRKKLIIGGAVLVLLVALYAAAGYWIAPGYVREALAEAAQARGLVLEMTSVETKPFALRVELGGIALRGPKGHTFAEAERASADLAWASLWRRGWIVDSVHIVSPDVALGKLPEVEAAASSGGEGERLALTIQSLVVENGTLRYAPRDFALEALTLHARELSTLDAAAGTYEAAARLADGAGQFAARGAVALAPFAAEGTLSVAALRAAQLLPEAAGQLQGEAMYTYRDGEFTFHDVSIAGSGLAYAGIELPQATLRAGKVPIPPRQPFQAAGEASVAPHGKIAAQGRVGLSPLELHLNLTAEALPLAQAQRWLPQGLGVDIASGSVSGTGRLLFENAISYQGSAAIRDLRLEERGSEALLLGWKAGETQSLRFTSSPLAIEADEIALRAPEGRLVIEENGGVNFAAVFPHSEGTGGEGLQASFERLRIEEGVLHFADRSLATPFQATIRELSGTVLGFSTEKNDPARVRLNGRVQPYGVARIRGTINLNAPTTLADITAVFRNLPLEAFNPYVAKFAGYRIESGRLSAELRYEVRDGRLSGTNQLAFQNMQLGEKLEQKGLLDLPFELAVALLADSKGRIDLTIPVRGNLNDPQFDMGAIVSRALGNVVRKVVTAPFRALAALFGGKDGDEHPGEIGFAPGSAVLSPPAEEDVARVAQALGERPRLGVEVQGAYDAQRDLQALRMRAAREAVASAAGAELPLDLSNPKVRETAEKLHLSRGGERQVLDALRKSEADYGRLLLERLAAMAPVDENAAQELARERAESVHAALLEHGVDPARVGLGAISGEKQPAATLALKPAEEVSAAAGAGGASSSYVEDPVRAAQERLNAAGFDAGPVDGILGPRTKRALIHYQAVSGLELTGELDRATRERLISPDSRSG